MADHPEDHTAETIVGADPDAVYNYLADVSHLPDYFPMMTSAEKVPGEDAVRTTAVLSPEVDGESGDGGDRTVHGEAWFRTDADARLIEWGSEGPSDYHGEIRVGADGEGSRISLLIHSAQDHDGIDEGLEQSLAAIVDKVGAGIEHI